MYTKMLEAIAQDLCNKENFEGAEYAADPDKTCPPWDRSDERRRDKFRSEDAELVRSAHPLASLKTRGA